MTAPALSVYVQGEGSVDADGLNTFVQSCNTVTELRGFIGTKGIEVWVRGLEAANDGGAGMFCWVEGGTDADNGVTVIVPDGATGLWLRQAALIGPSLTITEGASANLTAAETYVYVAKTVSTPTTLYLPAAPIADSPIVVIDALGAAGGNAITVDGNGALINGAATNVINTAYGTRKYVYSADLSVWLVSA